MNMYTDTLEVVISVEPQEMVNVPLNEDSISSSCTEPYSPEIATACTLPSSSAHSPEQVSNAAWLIFTLAMEDSPASA